MSLKEWLYKCDVKGNFFFHLSAKKIQIKLNLIEFTWDSFKQLDEIARENFQGHMEELFNLFTNENDDCFLAIAASKEIGRQLAYDCKPVIQLSQEKWRSLDIFFVNEIKKKVKKFDRLQDIVVNTKALFSY